MMSTLVETFPDEFAPPAPQSIGETGLDAAVLSDLILKLAGTVPNLTTAWASQRLCLPEPIIEKLFWQLKQDQLVEILGQTGELDYRYAITQRGREFARRALEVCGYVGPAPVSLEAYRTMLEEQIARRSLVTHEMVKQALRDIVLPTESVEVAALAALSGRSLFLFGPPGNGKTSMARMLHNVLAGELWIPHCIAIDSTIIRIFDPQVHETNESDSGLTGELDRRWVRIRPPLIVAGGEMTITELDLAYSPSLRFYEAPPHVKANGGTFVIDDFGRQRVDPHDLLNRWIIPLEHQVDHLTLHTGQKIEIPFRLMLTVATNLKVADVADAAFLRRMGYRLHLESPTPQSYAEIFTRYGVRLGLEVRRELVEQILRRYAAENRDLRASEPRDLLERARDICRLRQQPLHLDEQVLDLAWRAYFSRT
jgi:predicted ATPase with chaperone activity